MSHMSRIVFLAPNTHQLQRPFESNAFESNSYMVLKWKHQKPMGTTCKHLRDASKIYSRQRSQSKFQSSQRHLPHISHLDAPPYPDEHLREIHQDDTISQSHISHTFREESGMLSHRCNGTSLSCKRGFDASTSQTSSESYRSNCYVYPDESEATATLQSIAPPPPHNFTLAELTGISMLLKYPQDWLSEVQGGKIYGRARTFNMLALITHIGSPYRFKDRFSDREQLVDKCKIIVRDWSGCVIQINLIGTCARDWTIFPAQESSSELDSGRNENINWTRKGTEMLHKGAISRKKNQGLNHLMGSLQEGDVVVFSNLHLSRIRCKRKATGKAHHRKGSFTPLLPSEEVVAVANPKNRSHLEICWRNKKQHPIDESRNFDPALIAYDARCRAIHQLATLWTHGEKTSKV